MKLARAVSIIDRLGIVLVYPIANKPDPPSLWSALHPRREMKWTWDADADPRVAELWHLRERLARSSDVAYAKWFRGRATFFSLPVFRAMLGELDKAGDLFSGLPHEANEILERLRELSPRSTKELRALLNPRSLRSTPSLRGKQFESLFAHAMKALWTRLLIVGTGEVPDGAFPSLAVAASEMMFEDLWNARDHVPDDAREKLESVMASCPAFDRELARARQAVRAANAAARRSFDDDEL